MAGPGSRWMSGYWWLQGPTIPRAGQERFASSRKTVFRYGSAQPPTARTAALIEP
jgi:hypothetical protein